MSISVIVPCFNAGHTLARALDSCLAQPEATQILVVDDGSQDASATVCAAYARQYSRIELLRMPQNGGAACARNWGALNAAHPLLAFLDADDEYLPGALRDAVEYLARHPREPSIRLDVEYCGFPADIVAHPDFRKVADTLSNTVPSSLVIRRSAYAALGGFPADEVFRRLGGEDGAFSLALLMIFGNPRLHDRKRVRMHYHPSIHAERFFRGMMGMQAVPGSTAALTLEASRRFAQLACASLREMREFNVSKDFEALCETAAKAANR
ncbi:glycosyltransferase family 2 protein [Paraburkholderia unamae]|uniref:Glycosyl transferase family 2 n=1 Tax=Paraburkholderia unamae TaxID=219649 RepID=A0ABX5KWG2_9BURK|nr:glycosyltransferase family 2 protein [Paraburkholderia unamae]PVX97922.1 glycosyl transferase family 2 [Paraburkholderia unamae]